MVKYIHNFLYSLFYIFFTGCKNAIKLKLEYSNKNNHRTELITHTVFQIRFYSCTVMCSVIYDKEYFVKINCSPVYNVVGVLIGLKQTFIFISIFTGMFPYIKILYLCRTGYHLPRIHTYLTETSLIAARKVWRCFCCYWPACWLSLEEFI